MILTRAGAMFDRSAKSMKPDESRPSGLVALLNDPRLLPKDDELPRSA